MPQTTSPPFGGLVRWAELIASVPYSRHPAYLSLGVDIKERAAAWRRWLDDGISEEELIAVRLHLAQERALGDDRLKRMVEQTLNRPASCRPRERPKKDGSEVVGAD